MLGIEGHDVALMGLSVFIAIAASYTALDLATRIPPAVGAARKWWLWAAAAVLGGGIWSMHFIGMMAIRLPLPIAYDTLQTLASFLVALIATGVAFHVASLQGGVWTVLASGLIMGLGIVGMHYTGMAAMRMQAHAGYEPLYLAVAILVAIVASTAALWQAFRRHSTPQRLAAAVALGIGISGMHYLAMAGFSVRPDASIAAPADGTVVGSGQLVTAVTASTLVILFSAILAVMYDRRSGVLADRAAAMVRDSEERFRLLYRHTPLPLHSLGADGRIQQVSHSWLELLGYREEEVMGRLLTDFMTPDSARRRNEEHWPRLLSAGELHEAEYTMVAKDGRHIDCILSAVAERDAEGHLTKTVCGLVDVTERRRTESALRQAQKLEAVGQLTGGIAHDFNNLLAVIVGNLELARRRAQNDERLRTLLENTMQAAQRGAALTQRMLAFARRQDLKPEPIDVPELVLSMADLLRRSIGPAINVETRFPLGLPKAMVDANQLELALLNLVVNARDAMPEGGTVVISAREARAEVAGEADEASFFCLTVADDGVGMDEATLARATEPFFTTKGVGKGTGLGLAMVHGLAAQSGGRLALTSQPGKGTAASIYLPIAADARAVATAPSVLPVPQRAAGLQRVLVVDDDPLVLSATAAMIEDLGYQVAEAGSAKEALATLEGGEPFDVVLTDQAMPGMTGLQLAEAISERFPSLPVILGTGYAELPNGADAHFRRLAKPFGQDVLDRELREVLQGATDNVVSLSSRHG
ncbi:MHYT domain-containing protein [Ancylobacter oerskovii]|uniref:histidine kinase n=1 Tax=Ancylobacter oerskovii TaxID=459519 RepID=A0ABW4YRM3_9HYPH|nr:MHYT domain-containing protein [Ancylobacter oerskovii]MBS7545579.1 response regulator [Ancylobacter oerskovii]